MNCEKTADCYEFGKFYQCKKTANGFHGGICVPKNCQKYETGYGCPAIGNACTSGQLSGQCNANTKKCIYDEFLQIATCCGSRCLPPSWCSKF